MAVFSGNPADRATGNVAPGSVREAAGSSMSNGTTRNNDFGGSLGNAGGDRGFSAVGSRQTVNTALKGDRLQTVNTSAKGDMLQTVNTATKSNRIQTGFPTRPVSMTPSPKLSVESASYGRGIADSITAMGVRGLGYTSALDRANLAAEATTKAVRGLTPRSPSAPVSRGVQTSVSSTSPKMKTGVEDYKSIVPGKVTMTAEKVPFAKENPSLAKYMGGTPAKPVNVSIEEAKKMAASVPKVGAYVSGASSLAKSALDAEALKQLGTVKKGYGTTTLQAGKGILSGTIDISYPKSVATGKSFGTYTAGSKASSGPVSRGMQSKASTGPVSRGASPAPKSSTGPVSRGMQTSREAAKPTVQQVRIQSKEKKAATVKSRITKDGYVYTRVGDKLYNFSAASDKDINRMRRNQK